MTKYLVAIRAGDLVGLRVQADDDLAVVVRVVEEDLHVEGETCGT